MKRGDRLMLLAFVLMLSVCAATLCVRHFYANDAILATISQNGKVIRTIALKDAASEVFVITDEAGGANTIRVAKGEIAVLSADCPDKDCVRRGALRRAGESAVCLPHRLVIRLSGTPEVDGGTY